MMPRLTSLSKSGFKEVKLPIRYLGVPPVFCEIIQGRLFLLGRKDHLKNLRYSQKKTQLCWERTIDQFSPYQHAYLLGFYHHSSSICHTAGDTNLQKVPMGE